MLILGIEAFLMILSISGIGYIFFKSESRKNIGREIFSVGTTIGQALSLANLTMYLIGLAVLFAVTSIKSPSIDKFIDGSFLLIVILVEIINVDKTIIFTDKGIAILRIGRVYRFFQWHQLKEWAFRKDKKVPFSYELFISFSSKRWMKKISCEMSERQKTDLEKIIAEENLFDIKKIELK